MHGAIQIIRDTFLTDFRPPPSPIAFITQNQKRTVITNLHNIYRFGGGH